MHWACSRKTKGNKYWEMHIFILGYLQLPAIPNDYFQIVNYLERQIMFNEKKKKHYSM